jgi:hypothetical protein
VSRLLLVALIACGDNKPPSTPPIPTAGTAAPLVDAAPSEPPTKFPLRALSGKPPRKTTAPIARATLDKLAALAMPDFTSNVRKLDDGFLDVELQRAQPPLRVTVTIQPCLRCLPMEVERWRAETDALRVTIPPDLRDRPDTTFEIAQVALGGAPVIATYQLGYAGDATASHAVTLYLADGVNQIRVTCAYAGGPGEPITREALASITRAELTAVALAVLDLYAAAW